MARIYTNVDVDIDIDVDEFLDGCRPREIKELVKALVEDGHVKSNVSEFMNTSKMTANEILFCDKMAFLGLKYLQMTNEETEYLEKIYEKYN